MKALLVLLGLLIYSAAYPQSHVIPQFPFGLHNGMSTSELARIAKGQQAELVTRVDEHGVKSLIAYPRNVRFQDFRVDSYTTEFFNDRLWGVNVALKGCTEFSEHQRILRELVSFLKESFPGEVTSDKLSEFTSGSQAKSIYVFELKCSGVLLTVISHRNANATFSEWVTYTDLDPGKWSTAERVVQTSSGE
ncbi:MAG TPA: hypothetical protein VLY03_05140 [Bacteroidota bacterium]|nr:hypothetical protein [Bacteroidota bacterium]